METNNQGIEGKKKSYRGLKICCGVTGVVLLIGIAVIVTLIFTVFKPKQPQIIPRPVTLMHYEFEVFPALQINVSALLEVTIVNRNYGSFKYRNTTAYIYFHGDEVAEAPIGADTIPSRGRKNMTTRIQVDGTKLAASPYLIPDYQSGVMNFTSSSEMTGDVNVFNIFKLHAEVHNQCDITVYINTRMVDSVCRANFKL